MTHFAHTYSCPSQRGALIDWWLADHVFPGGHRWIDLCHSIYINGQPYWYYSIMFSWIVIKWKDHACMDIGITLQCSVEQFEKTMYKIFCPFHNVPYIFWTDKTLLSCPWCIYSYSYQYEYFDDIIYRYESIYSHSACTICILIHHWFLIQKVWRQ